MDGLSLVIVGGGSGLGALLAEMAVEAGATGIGIIDINEAAAEVALAPARARGLPAVATRADIANGPDAHAGFGRMVAGLGRVDVLINCAAIYPRRPILEITDAEWDLENAINIKGTYHMMVAAVRHMQGQPPKDKVRGRIVNLTSVDAFKPTWTIHTLAALVLAMAAGTTAQAGIGAALKTVQARGALLCTGHDGSCLGFAEVDDKGNWQRLDIDLCRAVGIAIFGDPSKTTIVPVNWAQRCPTCWRWSRR